MASGNSISFLNVTVKDIEDTPHVFELLKQVKPGWVLADLESKGFDTGGVNEMKVFYQRADGERDDAVVVRVYGDGLGDANPRDTEFLAMQIGEAAGCFPTIYASFKNGVAYKYAKGHVPGFKDLTKPEVITSITSKLYRLNHIDFDSLTLFNQEGKPAKFDGKIKAFSRMKIYINQIPDQVEDPEKNGRFHNLRQELTNEKLLEEYKFVKQVLEETQIPVVFCHGDLHPRNMVLDDATNEVMFVDFELTGVSYGCWDLSYLLTTRPLYEFLGWVDESEPDISGAIRLLYIKGYLTAMFKSLGKEANQISDLDIEYMDLQLKLVDLSVYCHFLAAGLAWAILPRNDLTRIVPPAKEKYTSLKLSLNDIKTRYLELKTVLYHSKIPDL